ncbi:DUF6479 family protein [Streptomyces syringium]|uniref:DUF6479 family protein n=1 Tax=Streptomyces syringium TaxID=76729 RepID=UPI00367C6A02
MLENMDLANRDHLVGIAPAVVGVIVTILLIVAVFWGRRKRDAEPPPPAAPQRRMGAWSTPEEQREGAKSPDHGPGHADEEGTVGYVTEHHEQNEVPPLDQEHRMLPHELNPASHEEELSEERKKWHEGGSGGFGSGGGGHT